MVLDGFRVVFGRALIVSLGWSGWYLHGFQWFLLGSFDGFFGMGLDVFWMHFYCFFWDGSGWSPCIFDGFGF